MWIEKIAPFVKMPIVRKRIEISRLTFSEAQPLLVLEDVCPSCHQIFHPVKMRNNDALRVKALEDPINAHAGTLYVTGSCTNIHCMRTDLASAMLEKIKLKIEEIRR